MESTEIALCEAELNIRYVITEIRAPEELSERLRELGVIRGTVIKRTVVGRDGGIAVYSVRGCRIALRRETAMRVSVKRWEE